MRLAEGNDDKLLETNFDHQSYSLGNLKHKSAFLFIVYYVCL